MACILYSLARGGRRGTFSTSLGLEAFTKHVARSGGWEGIKPSELLRDRRERRGSFVSPRDIWYIPASVGLTTSQHVVPREQPSHITHFHIIHGPIPGPVMT